MAGRIRASDIDEVKARTNIVDVVGAHVSLKSAGVGSLRGLCPFHDEKSPSFHVRPQVGFYHCFGCGESGDVYSFVQKIDQVSFTEAVERLAERLGIELHYDDGGAPVSGGPARARLYAANAAAAEFFQAALRSPEAQVGRTFLGERGFNAQAAERFGVGYAPKGWDALTKHLLGLGFSAAELAAAGLVSSGDRGNYDRFRGRLVWPIRDITGQTIGFGARRLYDDDKGPKYLNTPETTVYHKAQVLYGLDLARKNITKARRVVVVEGYTDVMAAHLAGVDVAVATCGTAFGAEHLKLLRRVFGDEAGLGEIIFTFDPDDAGEKAALRAFSEARTVAAQAFVAAGQDGLDPCDLRITHGDAAVRAMVEARIPMFEFVLRHQLAQYNLATVEGRVGALRSAAAIVADIRDPIMRREYTHELARFIGIDRAEVERAVRGAHAAGASAGSDVSAASARAVPAGGGVHRAKAGLDTLPNDALTRLEREAIQVLVQHADVADSALVSQALQAKFSNPALAVMRDALVAARSSLGSPGVVEAVCAELPSDFIPLAEQLAVLPVPLRDGAGVASYANGVLSALIERDLLRQKADLLGRLTRTMPESAEYAQIQVDLVGLEATRRAIRGE